MSQSQPFISIIVPTRNRVDWLRRCLNGIAEQTFPDYEVIVVDDGSSADVMESYRGMMLEFGDRYSLLEANSEERRRLGPSVIRNMGIQAAIGEYVAFCDDDDYWCQADYLSVAADSLRKTGADLHFANQRILHGDEVVAEGSFRHVKATLKPHQCLQGGLPIYQVGREQMLSFPDYAHLNITIARKTLLDQIGGFWEETRYAEDVDLFVRLCDQARGILFRPDVCSTHNAPVKHDRESASKAVGDVNRRLLENSVYWHLLACCRDRAAIHYAKSSLASNAKLLTGELQGRGVKEAAGTVARVACAASPSFKWGLYSLWLSLKGRM
ncbi:MAG: glycosyltransferase family A protein [Porticoccaceae bacterium]